MHFRSNRHTSAWPRRRATNDLTVSPLSWVILESVTLAALLFSSCTAMALMAARRFGSVYSLRGVGPVAFMVTSRRSLGSRHASSWMVMCGAVRLAACEYSFHRLRKYCHPFEVSPADSSGLGIWVGLKEAARLWSIEMWPVMRATAIPGSVPSAMVKGQPALGQVVAMWWVGDNWKSVSEAF